MLLCQGADELSFLWFIFLKCKSSLQPILPKEQDVCLFFPSVSHKSALRVPFLSSPKPLPTFLSHVFTCLWSALSAWRAHLACRLQRKRCLASCCVFCITDNSPQRIRGSSFYHLPILPLLLTAVPQIVDVFIASLTGCTLNAKLDAKICKTLPMFCVDRHWYNSFFWP